MGVELILFELLLGVGAASFLLGLLSKTNLLFYIGCALLIGSGAVLWGSGGLITSHYYDVDGVLQAITIPMTDTGLAMLALALVGFGVLGAFVAATGEPIKARRVSPFHY